MHALRLERRPVAVTFREIAAGGCGEVHPASCRPVAASGVWQPKGGTFYTVPGDHYNCPVGSYTHNIALPGDRARELDQTSQLMTGIGYIQMKDIPGVFRLPDTP